MNVYRGEMPSSYSQQAIEQMLPLNRSQLTSLIVRLGLDISRLPDGSAPPINTIELIPGLCEQSGISWNELFTTIHFLREPPRGRAYVRFQQMRTGWDVTGARNQAPVPRPAQSSSRRDGHEPPAPEARDATGEKQRLIVQVLDLLQEKDERTVEWLMDVFLGEEKFVYSKRAHLSGVAPLVSFVRLVAQRPGDLEQLWEVLRRV